MADKLSQTGRNLVVCCDGTNNEIGTGLNLFPGRPAIREAQALWPFHRGDILNSLCHDQPDLRFQAIWAQQARSQGGEGA